MISFAKSAVKRLLPDFFIKCQAYRRLIGEKQSYLYTSGWMESLRRGYPCDAMGIELPWMNFPTVSILSSTLTKDSHVFEYGSGYSTLFYAAHAKSVVSVEHDASWRIKIQEKLPTNARVEHIALDEDGEYCRAIHRFGNSPDLVIIDGRDRVNCLKQCLACCDPSTVILLDDSDREHYASGIKLSIEKGYRVLNIEGLKPGGLEVNRSSFIYRNGNSLQI